MGAEVEENGDSVLVRSNGKLKGVKHKKLYLILVFQLMYSSL